MSLLKHSGNKGQTDEASSFSKFKMALHPYGHMDMVRLEVNFLYKMNMVTHDKTFVNEYVIQNYGI
jgi:hypothetical protein